MSQRTSEYFVCPVCGSDVPTKAKACPACGADENTGWSEQTYLDGIDLPGDDDYNEMVGREFGSGTPSTRHRPGVRWAAGLVVGLMLLGVVFALARSCDAGR